MKEYRVQLDVTVLADDYELALMRVASLIFARSSKGKVEFPWRGSFRAGLVSHWDEYAKTDDEIRKEME